MADLVTLSEFSAYLGESIDAGVGEPLLDQVEAMLEAASNRTHRPFAAAAIGRTERHDGTGRPLLYLDYPIAALTSVKLGADVGAPDETLDVADQTTLSWQVARARLQRVDGQVFGETGQPGVVHVTYTTADDLPELAALAVKRAAAALWHQIGQEAVTSERLGAWNAEFRAVEADPTWQAAVAAYRVMPL